MRINISALKHDLGATLSVQSEVDPAQIDWGEGVTAVNPVLVQAQVTNVGRCFIVRGRLTGNIELTCDRCLQPFGFELNAPFEEEFFTQSVRKQPDADTPELFAETSTFVGDIIDLSEAIQEQAVLTLPYKALCKQSCAGLCVQCGQNLNVKKCGCKQDSIDPRLAGLASLLDKNTKGMDQQDQ